MSKNVTIISPSEGRSAILRVAAYCRVSTDSDDQATSYASQIHSYTELISQHEGWELVDIYADMYNQRLIQCPAHMGTERWLK